MSKKASSKATEIELVTGERLPPQLSEKLIAQLQRVVHAARRSRISPTHSSIDSDGDLEARRTQS
jgi:hypothetical protein